MICFRLSDYRTKTNGQVIFSAFGLSIIGTKKKLSMPSSGKATNGNDFLIEEILELDGQFANPDNTICRINIFKEVTH